MDFTKIKSVKDYIREQEEEEIKNAENELDQKIEALFLTGEPVNDETLQVFADENSMDINDLKSKIFTLMTTLLTARDEEKEESVEEAVVTDTNEEDMNSGDEEALKEDDESTEEEITSEEIPEEDEENSTEEEEETASFDIGDKVSFEVENEEHPLANTSLEVINTDGEFVQCLAENPETGVQSTYWFKNDELKKIPNEIEVNPSGDEVEDVENVPSEEEEYEEVKTESLSSILRRNLSFLRG